METKDVKIALENYHFFVSSIERVQLEIEELNAKRFKAGGSIARRPENPVDRESMILDNLEKLEKLERQLDVYQFSLDLANHFLGSLEGVDKSLVRDKYINRLSTKELEFKYNMDRKTIWRKINQLLIVIVNSNLV